jgi:hypothetical protein
MAAKCFEKVFNQGLENLIEYFSHLKYIVR